MWGEFDVDCETNDVSGPQRDLVADLTHGYVRAAPGRLHATEYDATTGALVASGEAGDSRAPVVIFLPGRERADRVVDVNGLRPATSQRVGGGTLLRAVPTGGAWAISAGATSE